MGRIGHEENHKEGEVRFAVRLFENGPPLNMPTYVTKISGQHFFVADLKSRFLSLHLQERFHSRWNISERKIWALSSFLQGFITNGSVLEGAMRDTVVSKSAVKNLFVKNFG